MKRSHKIQQKGDEKMRKRGLSGLSPEVERFLFPNGRPSVASEMDGYWRRRIRSKAVLEFLLGGKKV